jgi:hypothetical protein
MKSSVEAKVAAAVGSAFIALTAIAIAQGNNEGQTGGGPRAYGPTNNTRINTHTSQPEYNSGLQPPLRIDAIQL